MKPNPLLDELGELGEGETSGAETETGAGEGPDDTDTDTDTGMLPDLPDGDGDGDGDDGDGDGDGDGMNGEICEPLPDYEAGCGTCLSASCCALVTDCAELDGCSCLSACMLAGGNNGTCKNACGGTKPSDVPEVQQLLSCADELCSDAC